MDTNFYSIGYWRKRKEDYHNDADPVLVFKGGLHDVLNFGGDTGEFDDYIETFGYYYELDQTWNMGFYPIPVYDFTLLKGGYPQRLQDSRAKKMSSLVKKRAEWKCQDCGSTNQLETHHCYYINMRDVHEPWELSS